MNAKFLEFAYSVTHTDYLFPSKSDTFTFTTAQLEALINRIVEFQVVELSKYRKEELDKFTYMEDDVPSFVMINRLSKISQ